MDLHVDFECGATGVGVDGFLELGNVLLQQVGKLQQLRLAELHVARLARREPCATLVADLQ